MKLEPFDLERALAGDKVVTRDGKHVTKIIKFDVHDGQDAICGVYNRAIITWRENGKFYLDHDDYDEDLFMAAKEKNISYFWIIVNSFTNKVEEDVFDSEFEAERYRECLNDKYLKLAKCTCEIEEDE